MTSIDNGMSHIERVLAERARKLAIPLETPVTSVMADVIVSTLAGERYAIENEKVVEVFRLQTLSVLPGAPDPIAGITSHRGELLTIVDVRRTLGLSPTSLNDLSRVLIVERPTGRVGVLVDSVEGMEKIPVDELYSLAGSRAGSNHLKGITAEGVALLDLDSLLALFDGGRNS